MTRTQQRFRFHGRPFRFHGRPNAFTGGPRLPARHSSHGMTRLRSAALSTNTGSVRIRPAQALDRAARSFGGHPRCRRHVRSAAVRTALPADPQLKRTAGEGGCHWLHDAEAAQSRVRCDGGRFASDLHQRAHVYWRDHERSTEDPLKGAEGELRATQWHCRRKKRSHGRHTARRDAWHIL